MCTQLHLNNDFDDEGHAPVLHPLQDVEDRDSKHDEEISEKNLFHQDLGAESVLKKRNLILRNHVQQKNPSALSH